VNLFLARNFGAAAVRDERTKVWINTFQTRLVMRIAVYCLIYMITLVNMLFAWRLLVEGPGDPVEQYFRFLQDYSPALVLVALLLPAVAWDALKFSHRMVGPLVRFRRALQDMAAGQPIQPIKLRNGDYLVEMRDEFNSMLEALQRLGVPVLKPTDPTEEGQRRTAQEVA
jgi:hypothetical protein